MSERMQRNLLALVALVFTATSAVAADWSIQRLEGMLRFKLGETTVAEYVYADESIPRSYFANLRTPSGVQVTRNHPPIAGEDRMDHPDYHPGVWLAFGDLSGSDNWRLKARVEHVGFIQPPSVDHETVSFAVEHRYTDSDGETICRSRARHTLSHVPLGILIIYDETFFGDESFTFGDQEEMGLGIRVATPLRIEKSGPNPAPVGTGEIVADGDRQGTKQIWGKPAAWIDYRGDIEGGPAGMAIFCHRDNFRASRMHARDYGFVCANPFALAAFIDKAEPSRTTIHPGESLRLRYGVLCHAGTTPTDEKLDSAYEAYLKLTP